MQHLIIGYGEIGKTICEVLRKNKQSVECFDIIGSWNEVPGYDPENNYDVIHICFGYNKEFIQNVREYSFKYKPRCVIIHSTVKPGTCEKLDINNLVYSPVRGRHKDTLTKHVLEFVKYYSANSISSINIFRTSFSNLKTTKCKDFKTLETTKIMCTTYMYWCLMFQKVFYKYCQENGIDFDFAYEQWNKTYNDKCDNKTFPKRFARPIYDNVNGMIGGHCLVPNIELVDNEVTKILKKFDKSL